MPVTNEGLGWDSLLKMVHHPGGDWHPGWGGSFKSYLAFEKKVGGFLPTIIFANVSMGRTVYLPTNSPNKLIYTIVFLIISSSFCYLLLFPFVHVVSLVHSLFRSWVMMSP